MLGKHKNTSMYFESGFSSSVLVKHYELGVKLYARLNKRLPRWSPIDCVDVQDFFLRSLSRDSRDLSTFKLRIPKEFIGLSFYQKLLQAYRKRIGIDRVYVPKFRLAPADREHVMNVAVNAYMDALDTPISHEIKALFNANTPESILKLLSFKTNPLSAIYAENSDLFLRDYAAVSFLRKYEGFDIGVDTQRVALKQWIKAEEKCQAFNKKCITDDFSKAERKFFFQVAKVIQRILGPCPSITEIRENLRFGPGATTSTPSKFCSIFDKLESNREVSPQFVKIAGRLFSIENEFGFSSDSFELQTSSKWASVKKTALTDRGIEIPIFIDSMGQMALGSLIRKALKRFGLDLDTQADRNGLLAKFGSIYGSIATIDLESASDSISYYLVKMLLPKGWFQLLNSCRSRLVEIQTIDSPYHVQKFSAMGNGYTFELESLIFLAVTLVKCGYLMPKRLPSVIGVFGDDICCPAMDADNVIEGLTACGFTINSSKSYTRGPFRESCGQDFFLGAPVRPYFQKKEVTDVTRLYTMANGIRRVSVRSLHYYGSDLRYHDVWQSIVQLIPKSYRIFGSEHLGDTVIWGNPADGVQGFWPVYTASTWGYRKRQLIRAEHRTINYSGYEGGTLIKSWLLQKGGRISLPFDKRSVKDRIEESIVLPRVFRDSIQYEPKWYHSSDPEARSITLNGCDCPPFI